MVTNNNLTINDVSAETIFAFENAVTKVTAVIASTNIGDLAEAFDLSADDFGNLTATANNLPELLLANVIRLPEVQNIPILGHYEVNDTEIFPLYYLGKAVCPKCDKKESVYGVILATSQGCVFSACMIHDLHQVYKGVNTVKDVRKYLEHHYNLLDVPSIS